jgi:hypothetical protein
MYGPFSEEVPYAGAQQQVESLSVVSGVCASGVFQALRAKAPAERPVRVIHVGQSLVRAGIEYWLKALIRFSDPRRVQFVRNIVTSREFDPEMAAELGIPTECGGRDTVRQAAAECDVLLCWGPRELGGWLEGARPRCCVFVAHGESHWTRRILDGCQPIIDHVVAVSRQVQKCACQGFPSTVIANGVDAEHLAQSRSRASTRERLGFAPRDFVRGFVGRFADEKRAERVIQAVADLPRHFKALLVGWGPRRTELMELANYAIPGRYAFVLGERYVGDYYHAMDAFCLPSSMEGFGLVVAEAMMCGVPVIATAVGIVPEWIQHRVNGLVVTGDAASIRAAAQLLHQHPVWAKALGAEGKLTADAHGHASRMARQYEQLFQKLLHTPSPSGRGPG